MYQPCLQMNEIVRAIWNENDMLALKEYMLAAMQLYYDGIVQNPVNGVWHQLCDLSRQTVLCYYQRIKRPDDFLDKFKQIQEQLIDHSPVLKSKQRHLTGDEYFVERFVKAASSLKDINLIIAVASGGFEPALYLSALNGIEMDAVRYSNSKADREVRFYGDVAEHIKGRSVLIVDDILASGYTAYQVSKWVKLQKPEAAYFGVVKNLGNDPAGFRKINENLYEVDLGRNL